MIDLVAQEAPVYRGHKLARIVGEYDHGFIRGLEHDAFGPDWTINADKPISTKAWARLDIRVIGNPWGLSVSEISSEDS